MARRNCICALVCICALLSIIACGNDPRKFTITEANKDKFIEEIKQTKGLTVDESRLLFAYMLRYNVGAAFGGERPSIVGKTVGDLIEAQSVFEASEKKRENEQAKQAAEEKAKEDARAAELRKTLSLVVYDKGFISSSPSDGRFSDYLTIKVVYTNTSSKDIRAFRGRVHFTDLFGKEIYASDLTISEPIRAGEKANWDGSIEYNQFRDQHKALRNAELKDMRIVWVPASILFEDGTQMGEQSK